MFAPCNSCGRAIIEVNTLSATYLTLPGDKIAGNCPQCQGLQIIHRGGLFTFAPLFEIPRPTEHRPGYFAPIVPPVPGPVSSPRRQYLATSPGYSPMTNYGSIFSDNDNSGDYFPTRSTFSPSPMFSRLDMILGDTRTSLGKQDIQAFF